MRALVMNKAVLRIQSLNNIFQAIPEKQFLRLYRQTSYIRQESITIASNVFPLLNLDLPQTMLHRKLHVKACAVRRRRAYLQSDTYVLMEPGKSEEFVSEEELRLRLKGWLENWPEKALPPDLARFKTIDDAVSHLVRSVCELEIDGEVGSIQWYQVQLE
ncbi:protein CHLORORESPIRATORY REDUCTION 7, chloroplastic [Canna indica]|uniref:Protein CHLORORESPIRATORY REDUCTION 7, chloroplastic n=1 Tax=Canna indica TaxID=4628 RepID=A0AAQ3KVC1_9LILI|nr:protein CHLORORESPIRATORY REDUCTION 7, chloroplastic [Canna indica]